MNSQIIDSQVIKLLSKLTSQDLKTHEVTSQLIFLASLITLLKGVIHADKKIHKNEAAQFRETLYKLDLSSNQIQDLVKLLLSGIQKNQFYKKIDYFLILINSLSKTEKLLLFGLGYRMAAADLNLHVNERNYLRGLGKKVEIESYYLDVLEASFSDKPYINQNLQKLCNLIDPARFHDLGTIFMNAADDLSTTLNKFLENDKQESQKSSNNEFIGNDRYQKLQNFQVQKKSVLKRINKLSGLIDDGISENFLPITFRDNIQLIKARLASQHFRISVIGDFSQGKSTLLNALLGEEIQPVRAIPCSGTLSILKYGERQRVICRYRDGHEEEISIEHYQEKASISRDAALNNRSEELLSSNITEIVFEHPNLLLCRNGVEIVDSPGLNEHPERTRITEALLRDTDAILFMTNANKILTQSERDIIGRIKESANNNSLKNFFLVVNFMDNIDNEEDRNDIQTSAESIIRDDTVTGQHRIHFISAKSALKDTLNKKSSKYTTSFYQFTHALETFLTDERGSVILNSVDKAIIELTQDCINELNNAAESINIILNTSYQTEILERISEVSGRFVSISKMADSLKQEALDSALDSWEKNSAQFSECINKRSQKWKTEHNPFFSRDLLIQDYVECFNTSLQGEINRWVTIKLNKEIILPALNLLEKKIREELKALDTSFSSLDRLVGTNFDEHFRPAFNDYDPGFAAAAWAAGGVAGGGAGAAAAFLMIPALALGPAIIMGVAAAAVCILGVAADADKQIIERVCKAGFKEFKQADNNIKERIKNLITTTFDQRTQSVDHLMTQMISECENRLKLESRKREEEKNSLISLIMNRRESFKEL